MLFISRNHTILIEHNLIEHIILEVVSRPVEVHDFEDWVAGHDDNVHLLLDIDLPDVYEWVRVGLLGYLGPYTEGDAVDFVAWEVELLGELGELH